ncbi:MAG: SIS domain-containing protein, partial [Clostridia bacterium]|nr:SIS domain-containing protein [Clostridia bacterium]
MTTFEYMKRSVDMERAALMQLHEIMDETAFVKAIELLKASTLTVTSACGSSGFSAKKFAHSLCCVECPAKFVSPAEAVHGGMGALKKGNLLVLVSKGGKSEELIPLAEIAKAKEAHVLTVTANPASPLAQMSDVVLLLPDVPE